MEAPQMITKKEIKYEDDWKLAIAMTLPRACVCVDLCFYLVVFAKDELRFFGTISQRQINYWVLPYQHLEICVQCEFNYPIHLRIFISENHVSPNFSAF